MRTIDRTVPAAAALAVLVVGFTPAGCDSSSAVSSMKIGIHQSLSGGLQYEGRAQLEGMTIAIEHFQADTGVEVLASVYDDASSPTEAAAVAEKLIQQDGVVALMGGYGGDTVAWASEVAERHKIPYLTSGALASLLATRGYRHFFRLTSIDGYVRSLVDMIAALPGGVHKVALAYTNDPSNLDMAQTFKWEAPLHGLSVVSTVQFYSETTTNKPELAPFLEDADDLGADVLVVIGYRADYMSTIRTAASLGIGMKAYVAAYGLSPSDLVAALGAQAEGTLSTTAWQRGSAPERAAAAEERFVADYVDRYAKEPDSLAMLGYVQATLLLEAANRAGQRGALTPGDVTWELQRTDAMTPVGLAMFNEAGDPKYFRARVLQVQSGTPVVVYPEDVAASAVAFPKVPWKP